MENTLKLLLAFLEIMSDITMDQISVVFLSLNLAVMSKWLILDLFIILALVHARIPNTNNRYDMAKLKNLRF